MKSSQHSVDAFVVVHAPVFVIAQIDRDPALMISRFDSLAGQRQV